MGNRISAECDQVLALDGLEPRVPRAIQLEGTGFYVHGRVAVVASEPDRIHAVVRGSRPYDVSISVAESGNVMAACDCVIFRDGPSVCRHIWATLIAIQNEGLLRLPVATAATP